jgi:hypothetical protein
MNNISISSHATVIDACRFESREELSHVAHAGGEPTNQEEQA